MNLLDTIENGDKQIFSWGEIIWLHEPQNVALHSMSLAKVVIRSGMRQERHAHLGEEQLFLVVSGNGTFITNGVEETISASMLIYIPPHSEHEVINNGSDDLILIVVYVPVKLTQLNKPSTILNLMKIQDAIPHDIINHIQKHLSELLKLCIVILDEDKNLIDDSNKNKLRCDSCLTSDDCNVKTAINNETQSITAALMKCKHGLYSIEICINLNNQTVGFISTERFMLNIENQTSGTESTPDFKHVPKMIKSRIYVIQEHLIMAAQFIQVLMERNLMELELNQKENEILNHTKDKINLKHALNKAHATVLHEKLNYWNQDGYQETNYPYEIELEIEEAILRLDEASIATIIQRFSDQHFNPYVIKEMVTVLSRTTLRHLKNLNFTRTLRKKYNDQTIATHNGDGLDLLREFCKDVIDCNKMDNYNHSKNLIDQVNRYIENHYREDVTLNTLAEIFFISPNYLSKLFNEKNTASLTDRLTELRVEEAKHLLKNTHLKVFEIGKLVGYRNNSYFVNVFKKRTSKTPNEYRRK